MSPGDEATSSGDVATSSGGGEAGTVLVRYFAGARTAAGRAEEKVAADSLAALTGSLSRTHGPGLARILGVASFLVDGVAWHDNTAALPPGATVDVLPPFAGG